MSVHINGTLRLHVPYQLFLSLFILLVLIKVYLDKPDGLTDETVNPTAVLWIVVPVSAELFDHVLDALSIEEAFL